MNRGCVRGLSPGPTLGFVIMVLDCHVVLAANEHYGCYCAATIHSVCRNYSNPSKLFVHVLTSGFERRTADMISRAAHEHGSLAFIHLIDLARVASLPTPKHISADAYFRLLAPDALPDVDRFIYLDSDLVACDDISPLHKVCLDGAPVAGVVHRNSSLAEDFQKRFGLAHTPKYMNAGVLVVDAAVWREESSTTRIIEWMQADGHRLASSSQDAINHLFLNRAKELPLRWNVEARHFLDAFYGMPIDDEMALAILHPAIIHYTGATKPWMFESFVPQRETYLAHLDAVLLANGAEPLRRSRMIRNRIAVALGAVRVRLEKLKRFVGR